MSSEASSLRSSRRSTKTVISRGLSHVGARLCSPAGSLPKASHRYQYHLFRLSSCLSPVTLATGEVVCDSIALESSCTVVMSAVEAIVDSGQISFGRSPQSPTSILLSSLVWWRLESPRARIGFDDGCCHPDGYGVISQSRCFSASFGLWWCGQQDEGRIQSGRADRSTSFGSR